MTINSYSWLNSEGAPVAALQLLQSAVCELPARYIELLRQGNGGEVEIAVPPFNFCLDSVESALDYWRSGTYPLNDIFIFGGNGGGELFAFNLKILEYPVIVFDPIDPSGSIVNIAKNFDAFLELLDVECI